MGSDCLLEGPEDQPKGLEGLSEGSGGLPKGPIVDVVCQYVADINVYTALFCKSPLTVKNMYLGDLDQLVMDLAPPPQLHLHMGVVNLVMNVLINVWGLDAALAWCKWNLIIQRGYHGGQFDGNNSKKILERVNDLASSCPANCRPLVELLRAFHPIVSGCFGSSLDPCYHDLIKGFSLQFEAAQRYVEGMEGDVHMNVTWKIHILIVRKKLKAKAFSIF